MSRAFKNAAFLSHSTTSTTWYVYADSPIVFSSYSAYILGKISNGTRTSTGRRTLKSALCVTYGQVSEERQVNLLPQVKLMQKS